MDWYFLDSYSLLNLAASGRLAQIAKTLELRFSVIPKVYPNESQFVHQRDGFSADVGRKKRCYPT